MNLAVTITAIFTVAMAIGVVFSRNAIYSSFCMVLTFLGLSAIYIEWNSSFLGMIQILIYTGAIVVLFVFVVMLLNLHKQPRESLSLVSVGAATAAVWALGIALLRCLSHAPSGMGIMLGESGKPPTFRVISELLFTRYLWPFEVLSFFMLALIVAIYVLARPEGNSND